MTSGAHFPGPVRWSGEVWSCFNAQGGANQEEPWKVETPPCLWWFIELFLYYAVCRSTIWSFITQAHSEKCVVG